MPRDKDEVERAYMLLSTVVTQAVGYNIKRVVEHQQALSTVRKALDLPEEKD